MSKVVSDLVLTLEKQAEIYDTLEGFAGEKKQVIIENDLDRLSAITQSEEALIGSIIKLENLRDKLVDKLMKQFGIKSVETVSDLIPYLPPEEGMEIARAKDSLLGKIKQIKNTNELNSKLLEQSIEMINMNIDLMTTDSDASNYNGKATDQERAKRNLFDMKV